MVAAMTKDRQRMKMSLRTGNSDSHEFEMSLLVINDLPLSPTTTRELSRMTFKGEVWV